MLLPQTLLGPSANHDSCEGITYGVEARVSAVLTPARRLRKRLRLAARAVVGFCVGGYEAAGASRAYDRVRAPCDA